MASTPAAAMEQAGAGIGASLKESALLKRKVRLSRNMKPCSCNSLAAPSEVTSRALAERAL